MKPDLDNKDELLRWLSQKPHRHCQALGVRSALRAVAGHTIHNPGQFLKLGRLVLTSGAALYAPSESLCNAAHASISRTLNAKWIPELQDPGKLTLEDMRSGRGRNGYSVAEGDFEIPSAIGAALAVKEDARYPFATMIAIRLSALASSRATRANTEGPERKSARAVVLEAALRDAQNLELLDQEIALFSQPLWPNREPPTWYSDWGEHPDRHAQAWREPEMSFWRALYQGFLDGTPLDWELQRRVALIPDDDWKQGAAHIAGLIRRIETNFRTRVAPPLERDEDAGVFRIAPEPPVAGDTLEFARGRVALAVDSVIAGSGGNVLHDGSPEVIWIRMAIERHPESPSILAGAFYEACLSFGAKIGDAYPDDPAIINLKNLLYAASEEICEQSEPARNRCARLAALRAPKPLSPPERDAALEIAEAVAPEADAEAQAVIRADAGVIARAHVVPKWVRARFTNYVTTIAMWMDRTKKADGRMAWLAKRVGDLVEWWSGGGDAGG